MATNEIYGRTQDYITEQGLHERYLLPARTAQRWRQDGTGPKFIRLGRRRIVYRISDVEAWLTAHTFRHRADELARSLAIATE
jgi:hypothetical protein